jgi:hypothetical protein
MTRAAIAARLHGVHIRRALSWKEAAVKTASAVTPIYTRIALVAVALPQSRRGTPQMRDKSRFDSIAAALNASRLGTVLVAAVRAATGSPMRWRL